MGSGYSYRMVFADDKTADTPWHSENLHSFFCPKVPRLEERVEDDGNSGGVGNVPLFH